MYVGKRGDLHKVQYPQDNLLIYSNAPNAPFREKTTRKIYLTNNRRCDLHTTIIYKYSKIHDAMFNCTTCNQCKQYHYDEYRYFNG